MAVVFFLICKMIAFSTFRQKAIFFHLGGGGGGERGVALYRLYVGGFVLSVIFSLGGGLRLVALFDSQPSRFT